jgi:hypothetical protein
VSPPETLDRRVTRLEVLFENLGKQIGRELEVAGKVHESIDVSVTKLTEIVDRQDKRLDGIELRIAVAVGAIGLLVFLSQIFAPLLRQLFGLPA